ncbi:hypothetical protein C8035_v007983 [Colletotrichum spinosum]|uniref:Uncharacterized protein n=1 Tax=Colletotrichum spinosum TaxID=1347390 RepID=A0A4R8PSW1_9PEZI|nr:hypothetical protein C8035_v007983 [Colletotrichum spinosum]
MIDCCRLADHPSILIIILLITIIIIRTITILNTYNFNININFIKVINNQKNYNHFYKGLKGLALYKGNFTTFPSFFKITIVIHSFNILLENKAIGKAKRKIKVIKKNLALKSKVLKYNSKYFKYILEVTY